MAPSLYPPGLVVHGVSGSDEALRIEGLAAAQHEVDGSAELDGQEGHGFAFVVLLFQPLEVLLALRVAAQIQRRCLKVAAVPGRDLARHQLFDLAARLGSWLQSPTG